MFEEEDIRHMLPTVLENKDALEERRMLLKDYFAMLINGKKDPQITVPLIRRVLPRANFYPESYLVVARHINIPWMHKAIRKFHKQLGSVNIEGVLIPKAIVKGESSSLKKLNFHCKNVEANYGSLKHQANLLHQGMMFHSKSIQRLFDQ